MPELEIRFLKGSYSPPIGVTLPAFLFIDLLSEHSALYIGVHLTSPYGAENDGADKHQKAEKDEVSLQRYPDATVWSKLREEISMTNLFVCVHFLSGTSDLCGAVDSRDNVTCDSEKNQCARRSKATVIFHSLETCQQAGKEDWSTKRKHRRLYLNWRLRMLETLLGPQQGFEDPGDGVCLLNK